VSNGESVPAEIVALDSRTTPTGEPTPNQPTSTSRETFVYRIGVLSGISTDNFWAFYGDQPSVWNSYILGPTKPALYTLDSSGTMSPELGTAEVAPTWDADGWRVRIDLDPAYHWSDGEPITAEDFVFTFDTVRELRLVGSWGDSYPSTIESVHADGEHRLRIEFSERPNLSVWPYGVGLAPVMAEHVWSPLLTGITSVELSALGGETDVSGGPLTLAMASESVVVSHANPGYPDRVTPDTVEYHVYPDEASLVAAVAAGDIDSLLTPRGITSEQLATVDGDPSVSALASPANGVRYLGFNLDREPMGDLAFRTALALLLDRQALAETIPQTGDVAWSLIPRANGAWFEAEEVDVSRARYGGTLADRLGAALEGLKGAGYGWDIEPTVGADGALVAGEGLKIVGRVPQPLTILTPGDAFDPARPDYVQEITETLAIVGFDTRPVETDFDTVVDLAFTAGDDGALHYDMYLLGWTLGNPALPAFYRPLFSAEGRLNNTGYASDVFDRALAAYEGAFTVEEASTALWAMEQTLAADLPYLSLYTSQLTEIYRSDRVAFDVETGLGGLQARLGGIADVRPVD
jgi:ABC-type transport system substrate-binding protein